MPTRGVPFLMFPSRTGKGEKPLSPRGWERSPEPENREAGKKSVMSIKENRFTRVDEAVFVHGHTHSLFTWTGWWNGRQN